MDTPEAIVASVGIVASMAGAVTLLSRQPSKPSMDPMPAAALDALRKLTESSDAGGLHLAKLSGDVDRLKEDLRSFAKRAERDHHEIKLLRETLIAWGRIDGLKELRDRKSATDTDSIDRQ